MRPCMRAFSCLCALVRGPGDVPGVMLPNERLPILALSLVPVHLDDVLPHHLGARLRPTKGIRACIDGVGEEL